MNAIDLITALGRLLRDGPLRDAFVVDASAVAAQLAVRESDRAAFCRLAPADLEFQAVVLLRKRFGDVRGMVPLTCGRLGEKAWSVFHDYARAYWPESLSENVGQASSLTVHGASSPREPGGRMPPEPADKMSAPRFRPGSGGRKTTARDAHDFCRHLQQRRRDALCGHEWNRVRFALSGRWLAVYGVRSLPIRNRSCRALQVFLRVPSGRWHEVALFLGL